METEKKKKQYNVVGLLGKVSSPIARLVPIIQAEGSERMFTLGDGPEGGFSDSDFNELVEAGHVVRLSEEYPVERLVPKMTPDLVSESQRPFSLPYYALYLDIHRPEIEALKDLLVSRAQKHPTVRDESDRELWVVTTDSLIALFQQLFERVEDDLDDLLVETQLKGATQRYIGVRDSAAWEKAALLMELAYDYASSERAITYGALMRITDLLQDAKWYYWVSLACRVWGVEDEREHWVERVKAKWDALRVRAHRNQLVTELSLFGAIRLGRSAGDVKRWIDPAQEFRKVSEMFLNEIVYIFTHHAESTKNAPKPFVTLKGLTMSSVAKKGRLNATTYSRK